MRATFLYVKDRLRNKKAVIMEYLLLKRVADIFKKQMNILCVFIAGMLVRRYIKMVLVNINLGCVRIRVQPFLCICVGTEHDLQQLIKFRMFLLHKIWPFKKVLCHNSEKFTLIGKSVRIDV